MAAQNLQAILARWSAGCVSQASDPCLQRTNTARRAGAPGTSEPQMVPWRTFAISASTTSSIRSFEPAGELAVPLALANPPFV